MSSSLVIISTLFSWHQSADEVAQQLFGYIREGQERVDDDDARPCTSGSHRRWDWLAQLTSQLLPPPLARLPPSLSTVCSARVRRNVRLLRARQLDSLLLPLEMSLQFTIYFYSTILILLDDFLSPAARNIFPAICSDEWTERP